ncbi:MAG: diguanylate cyclase [Aquabacterium sp.]|jgi:diguanylate cyclase (GGDEF)-like protein|nr:MAG: diguanylate cyclase [Aquabacterium sp.]
MQRLASAFARLQDAGPWRTWSRVLLVRLAALLLVACAAPARAGPLPLELRPGQAETVLSTQAEVLEDPTGRLDLAGAQAASRWTAHRKPTFNFGFTRSAWWVRLRLHNAGDVALSRVVDSGSVLQDYLSFYVVRAGAAPQATHSGDRRAFGIRPLDARAPAIPLQLAPGETVDVYLRLDTHDGLHEALALKLWEPGAYARVQQNENLVFGLYFGALLSVLIYNLFLWISTRQRSFGCYSAYVCAFLVWGVIFRGYALQYLWPRWPVLNNQVLPLAAAACYCTFGLFAMSYLDTRRNARPWQQRLLAWGTAGNALGALPALFDWYAPTFALSIPFGVMLIVAAVSAGTTLLRAGSRPARYFSLAFALLTLGVFLYYMRVLGLLPSNAVTENCLQIGSALEVVLLSFGLADQMNELRAARLRAEREALAAQRALTHELEGLVAQRTRALEDANRRLAEISITDELTGVFNRRQFNAALQAEAARHQRSRTPLALCLFDIDHFKLYNDRYGHPAGDAVLREVAQAVRGRLRRSGDELFRIGGEEFALLLSVDEGAAGVARFVDELRTAIAGLAIEHAGSALGRVSASFGLVVLAAGAAEAAGGASTPEGIYALADQQLYAAKHAGRNRMAMHEA